jgi:hypothetical protein
MSKLSAEDLLAGAALRHRVVVPGHLLETAAPANAVTSEATMPQPEPGKAVVLRPLQLLDLQRIHKAAQDSEHLASVLMIQQSLVEPQLTIDQVNRLSAGLAQFLLHEVNRVSGLAATGDELEQAVQAPLARACFVLAREFGWTPEQCAGLSLGQILLYLEMLGRNREELPA